MKNLLGLALPIALALCIQSCQDENEQPVQPRSDERINFSPPSCSINVNAETPLHQKHLRLAKLLAVGLGQSATLRQAVKNASVSSVEGFFEEVFVSDFLSQPIEGGTIESTLSQIFADNSAISDGQTFGNFKTDLLAADPLVVLKIPDWFSRWMPDWDAQTTIPQVFSNRRGKGQLLYGFDGSGNCISKESFFDFSAYEVVVKTSEDFLWVEDQSFFDVFANPCSTVSDFFAANARSFAGKWLVKKRDVQKLFLGCAPPPIDPPPPPPTILCKRDEGFEHNYMLGFELANPGIIHTLSNQPCLGGEETFDFQIDFLYAARTEEAAAIDLKLPPIPLYGLRLLELVDIQFEPFVIVLFGIPHTYYHISSVSSKYYPIRSTSSQQKLDYMAMISPNVPEWLRDVYGNEIFVTWNETDFEICTSTGVMSASNTVGLTLNLGLMFSWLGKAQNPSAVYTNSYTKVSTHTVNVSGASVIPLGYNALGYCNLQTPGVPPSFWYLTGPQGLAVHYDYEF